MQKVAVHAVKFKRLNAQILADTVVDVHDVIAGANVAETADFFARVDVNFFAPFDLPAENIFLGEDGEFGSRERETVA